MNRPGFGNQYMAFAAIHSLSYKVVTHNELKPHFLKHFEQNIAI